MRCSVSHKRQNNVEVTMFTDEERLKLKLIPNKITTTLVSVTPKDKPI